MSLLPFPRTPASPHERSTQRPVHHDHLTPTSSGPRVVPGKIESPTAGILDMNLRVDVWISTVAAGGDGCDLLSPGDSFCVSVSVPLCMGVLL